MHDACSHVALFFSCKPVEYIHFFFFFLILFALLDSGHGGQIKDLDGDEADDFESVKLFGCVKLMFHVTYVKNYR